MTEQPEPRSEFPQTSTDSAQETARIEAIRSPDFKLVYVNNVSLHASVWDMHLTFGELYRDLSGKEVLEQKVTLAFSLQMAKALAAIVGNGVANYESQVGEIKMPEEMHITAQPPQQRPAEPSA